MAAFFWWFVVGGTIGALAARWFPGRPPWDLTMTMILGLFGAAAGGALSTQLFGSSLIEPGFDSGSLMLSTAGALLVVAAYMLIARRHDSPRRLP